MSRRKDRARTPGLWIATNALPVTGGHPFYQRLNQVLDTHAFDAFVEAQCAPFYAATVGRPSLLPGTYFRLLLIGYFEGIDSERGIAWRTADSLALRGFLGLDLDEAPPEHSTISRTRRLIDLETHRAVFTWILQVLGHEVYPGAIEERFGADIDFAQLIKNYSPPRTDGPDWFRPSARVVSTTPKFISGSPKLSRISTSHIERANLTVRMQLRRFTRLTNGFSKKLANLKAMVDVFFVWYNFCRVHQTLRMTPAMEAGWTDHVWSIQELLVTRTLL